MWLADHHCLRFKQNAESEKHLSRMEVSDHSMTSVVRTPPLPSLPPTRAPCSCLVPPVIISLICGSR